MRYPPEGDAFRKQTPDPSLRATRSNPDLGCAFCGSLDCFAVARNDDLPDSFILLTNPSGGYCNSYAKRIFPFSAPDEAKISLAKRKFRLRIKISFAKKTLRRRACNSLKSLAREIVYSAVPWNIKRLAVVLFRAPLYRRAWCRSVFGAVRPTKHHDTDSDFLEENQSLIFSHALGGRMGRRVRDWHDQDPRQNPSSPMPLILN